MRTLFLVLLFLGVCGGGVWAETALGAVKLLPRGEAKRLARIEAREGTPSPSRWYLIVHDPKSETGVHEYVVAGGEIVASRGISQFAENLQATDVIGADVLKVDSDEVAKIAQRYALANDAAISSMHYELRREGEGAAPLWNVTCLDAAGKALGHLVVTAGKGNVISHEGFPVQPRPPATPEPEKKPAKRPLEEPAPKREEPVISAPEPVAVLIATPAPAPTRKPNFFERVGGSLQKVIPGKKSTPPPSDVAR